MDSRSLVNEQTDDGERLIRELRKKVEVTAAFWLNPSEEGKWRLYIASPVIDEGNYDVPYKEVLRIF